MTDNDAGAGAGTGVGSVLDGGPAREPGTVRDFADHRARGRRRPADRSPARATRRTNPALSPDGRTLAFVSDQDGLPALWLADVADLAEACAAADLAEAAGEAAVAELADGARGGVTEAADELAEAPAVRLDTGSEHVRAVSWSPDGRWLACLVAPFGGEHTQVRVLRADGTGLRTLAGGAPGTAGTLGAWRQDGRALGVAETSRRDGAGEARAYAVDPDTGARTELAAGAAAAVCALHADGRRAVVRLGRRGARQLLLVDVPTGRLVPLLTGAGYSDGGAIGGTAGAADGSTAGGTDRSTAANSADGADGADATVADARFAADGDRLYLHTDSGRQRAALLTVPLGAVADAGGDLLAGRPTEVAARPDADVDLFSLCATPAGMRVAVVWNVGGCSTVEVLDPGDRPAVPDSEAGERAPVEVVAACAFSPDGRWLVLGVESPSRPPYVARRAVADLLPGDPARRALGGPARRTGGAPVQPLVPRVAPRFDGAEPVTPVALSFPGEDGLPLSGWWYAPRGQSAPLAPVSDAPAEAQQRATPAPAGRPAVLWLHGGPEAQERPTFAPLLQALVAAGVSVFAPNVRGSSGYGREFVNADNGDRRFAAIADVAAAARFLTASGLVDDGRIGVAGRSYGGYLTLAALVRYPELFRVGVDVCGMADLETFFAYTEPWIATAATTKYGDPERDRALLRELSPLRHIERLSAPLMVVHGEHDTNVPLVEAEQVVGALRERGASPRLLLFPDEGHEIHGTDNRATFVREVVSWLAGHLREVDERTA